MNDLEEFEKNFPNSHNGEGIVTAHGIAITKRELKCCICHKINVIETTLERIIEAQKSKSDPLTDIIRKQGGVLKTLVIPDDGKKREKLVYICSNCIHDLYLEEIDKILVFHLKCANCEKSIEIEFPMKSINLSFNKYRLLHLKTKEIGWDIKFAVYGNEIFETPLCPDCINSE